MNTRIIFIRTVMQLTGLSRQTIWRYVNAGKFPPPKKIDNRNAWTEQKINTWIDEQMS